MIPPMVKKERTIRVVLNPTKTKNLFGPISEIAGKELLVDCRNEEGDCICVVKTDKKEYLVDVDHVDIEK